MDQIETVCVDNMTLQISPEAKSSIIITIEVNFCGRSSRADSKKGSGGHESLSLLCHPQSWAQVIINIQHIQTEQSNLDP